MKKVITKKQVIKALKTEPLEFGLWFANPDKKDCKVCAVGAVLREVSFEKWLQKIDDGWADVFGDVILDNFCQGKAVAEFNTNVQIKLALKKKNYLGALSMKFESHESVYSDGYLGMDKVRKNMVKFVKENFPAKFTLEVTKSDILGE